MNEPLEHLLEELERFGTANDRAVAERPRRMLNITRDTGAFLAVLVHATRARRILEIGTSNGYSTLWLADAARARGGAVTTLELSAYKQRLAADNFARSGLSAHIRPIPGDAGEFLTQAADHAYDLVFLDSERTDYPDWWPDLKRVVRPGGLLIADNALSHPEQMAPFIALVEADPEFITSLVPVGKGEYLATRVRTQ